MKTIRIAIVAAALLAAGPVLADPPDHRGPPAHANANANAKHHAKGEKLERGNWGQAIDYRQYKLRAPPPGHEWRRVDDDYVLIALDTGIISSVIAISN